MPADSLRGLYIDLQVRGVEESTAEIESASQATEGLAEDFQDLVTNSELASKGLDRVEEEAESLGDTLTQTTGSAIALQASLQSLGDTQIGDIGDVDLSNMGLSQPEDKTVTQTIQRKVETNRPDISQLDFPSPEESKFEFPTKAEISGFEFDNQAESASLFSKALDKVKQSAMGSSVANKLASQSADETGDQFSESATEALLFNRALSSIRNTAYSVIPGLTATQSEIDEVGDEAQSSTANVLALRSALSGLGSTSQGVSLGPLTVGLGTAVVAASTLLPLVLSLSAAMGGLMVAGLGLAGVLGGALAGGFLSLSEQVGGTEALLTEFKTALEDAMAPLKQPIFAGFTLDVMRGAVKLLNQFSLFAAETFKQIKPLVDVVSAAFWDNTPEFFAALNYSITELAPLIADFMTWFANGMPEAIRYLTDVATQLAPVFKDIWDSIQPLLPELIELGVIIAQTLGPALGLLIDGLTLVVSAFNALPDFAQSGIILAATAIFTLVGAISLLGSAISGIIGIVGTFLTVLQFGSIIYGLVGGVGILSTALGGLSTALYAAGGAVSTFLGLIGPVGWAILAIGAGIAAYQTNLFGFADAIDSIAGGLADFGSGIVNAVLNPVESLNDALQWLANVDVIDVAVNLIKSGAEDLWNWLTPDMGNLGKKIKQMQKEAEKKYQNASPQERKRMEMVMEVGQQVRSPDLGNLIPDIPDKISMPSISMPDIPEMPQLDFSNLIPDLPQIDVWGKFSESFPRTAREIREETQLLKSVWEGLKVEAGNLKQSFDDLIGTPVANFFGDIQDAAGDAKSAFDKIIGTPIAEWFDSVVSDAQEWGNKLVEAIPSIPEISLPDIDFSGLIPDLPQITLPNIQLPEIDFSGVVDSIKTGLDVTLASIIDPSEMVPKVASYWYEEGVSAATSFISGVQEWIFGGLESTWNRLTPNVGSWFSDGKSAADTFIDGITSIDIGKQVGEWLKGLIPFMPSSDAQTGPLSNLTQWGRAFGKTILSGLKGVDIGQAVNDFFSGIQNWIDGKIQGAKQFGSDILSGLKNKFEGAKQWVSGLFDGPILPQNLSLPEISMPDTPQVDIPKPSIPDIGSLMPDMPSLPDMGSLMPDVSMPKMPDIPDLPSIDDITPSIKMPDMPDLPSVGNLMPSVSMPNIPSPSLPDIGSMIPSVQMPDMGGIQGAIPDIGPILGGNPLGSIPDIGPAPTPTGNQSVDNRDQSTNVSNSQDLTVEVNESDNPQQVRKEVEKVSSDNVVQDILGALQGHNE
jgi:hypothetical protein